MSPPPLVWVDLEMTGLDPERDVIVELAAIVTDGDLRVIEEGPALVVSAPPAVLDGMDPYVRDMHTRSGLLDEIRASQLSLEDAERELLAFVQRHIPEPRTAPLAGNSVHADRLFMRRYLRRLDAHLHYRIVDVSTVKELARRWYPHVFSGAPTKAEAHRALADIRESIAELTWYRQQLFR